MANPFWVPKILSKSRCLVYVKVMIHVAGQAQSAQARLTVQIFHRYMPSASQPEQSRVRLPSSTGGKRETSKSGAGLLGLLVDPVVQTGTVAIDPDQLLVARYTLTRGNLPSDLNGVELHAHTCCSCQSSCDSSQITSLQVILTENGVVLIVLLICAAADDGAEVVVLNRVLVLVDEVAPPLLAGLALHVVFDKRGGRVEVGELLHEMHIDRVVNLGQAQLGALDLLEDRPVCHEVLDSCEDSRSVLLGA